LLLQQFSRRRVVNLLLRNNAVWLVAIAAWSALVQDSCGQSSPIVFKNAHIIPVDQAEIPSGTLVVKDGKILQVGSADAVDVPAGAEVVDAAGKVIMPGLICTHSHLGGIGAADGSDPIQPGVRVFDSVNVQSSGFRRALAGGLTTLNIMPGSGHLSSGQTVYIKLRYTDGKTPSTIESLLYQFPDGSPAGGLKMANGTNPQGESPFPGTRGRSAYLVRQTFIKAQEYQKKVAAANGDPEKLPDRDLGLETLVEVLEGKRVVHHHTHRHDDIMTVLRLSKEFGFRVVLHHIIEGWRIPKQIAESGVPCSIILVDSPGGKHEAIHVRYDTAKLLTDEGVLVAFHTDDWITDSRIFFRMAALGIRGGLPRDKALAGLTLAGAKMLDLEDRIGSLTPGKDADFVILDGDPFSVYTKVLETWVEGNRVFDRSKPTDRLYAVGGAGAVHDVFPYFCCYARQHEHGLGQQSHNQGGH
jgi:imidazolonepropionase-like amidohydrolase